MITGTPTGHPYVGWIDDGLAVALAGNGSAAKSSDELGRLGSEYGPRGVAVVAIGSNDIESHPYDAPGRMVEFAGWLMPQQYTSIIEEHVASRTAVGMADISHMGRLRFDGDHAGDFLDSLVTRKVVGMPVGPPMSRPLWTARSP